MRRLRADKRPVETVSDALPVYKAGKYLTFRVARQDFAMSADCVRGILPVHEMVALETPHDFICGFAAVGGRDFPVLDLRAKLGIPHGSHGREPFIIVVHAGGEAGGRLLGFIADRVSELLDLRARDFRNGAVRGHGRPRRVLDPDRIMTADDWAAFWPNL
jgi:purine-binding chemotaxis protein CheW